MSDGEEPKLRGVTAKDLGYRDPLSAITRKIRGQLMFASAFAILVRVYQLEVRDTPWLHIDIPTKTPELLSGLLSVAVVYLFFVFWLYVYMDLKRWHLHGQVVVVQSSFNLLLAVTNHLNAIQQHIGKVAAAPENELEIQVRKVVQRAADEIPKQMDQMQRLQDEHELLSRVQWFRLIAVEIAVPALLGGVAIAKTWPALKPFLVSVFR